MSAPEVRRHTDSDTLVSDVATALLERLAAAQSRGEVPQVSLTGGTIADKLHHELARRTVKSSGDSPVDWSQVVFWWGDERFVSSDSPDRNARQAREALLDHVPLDPAHVHEVPASDQVATAEDAAEAYSATMRSAWRPAREGAGFFEVVMLGVGPDGHVASLFPGHPALAVTDEIAIAVHDSPKPPPDRVSLTFEALARAKSVWFLVSGAEKAEAVARALAADGTVQESPARGVRGAETVWWLDADAALRLDSHR